MRILVFLTGMLISSMSLAGIFPKDTFRTASNPWYWKHRKPHSDYWQQDVYYRIRAELDPDTREIKGSLTLTYFNNSPDTLHEFYFHLYQNAFQPGSYLDQLKKTFSERPEYGVLENEKKGTRVHSVHSAGNHLSLQEDNTLLKVSASKALFPGDSIQFEIQFSSWFDMGSERRRMKMFPVKQENGNSTWHFDGVHWYPRISAYDHRMTWDTQQHLGKEFYGDYGTWDVELTLPSEYILEATGELLNENEVLPENLKTALQLKNFKDKKRGTPASVIIPPDGKTKTWKYHAVNVHDFAFTADPTYRIEEIQAGKVRCIAVAQEQNAEGWQDAADIAAKVIQLYSDFIGPYVYPKMVVADAQDGMEYPMLTLDGGHSPGYTALLAHEIGHNWFFGMLGSNETYRAFMDEGFTQFLTMWAMDSLNNWPGEGISRDRLNQGYLKYMLEANKDHDGFLNTHADAYYAECGHGGQYSMAYHKTAVMLYNLQYKLGDEVFKKAMQFYFQRWAMAHPYPEDFRQAVTDFTHQDLTTFFDQWIETEKKVDYGISRIKRKNDSLQITFNRSGDLIMPLDFTVTDKNKIAKEYLIPVDRFVKTESGRTVLPVWFQFGELGRKYTVTVPAGKGAKVEIDPSRRLGDIHLMNNQSGLFPVKTQFALHNHKAFRPDWQHYSLHFRPHLWWNAYSGIQTGAMMHSHYLNIRHRIQAGISINTGWITSAHQDTNLVSYKSLFPILNYWAEYKTLFSPLGKDAEISVESAFRDGAWRNAASLEKWHIKGPSANSRKHGWLASWVFLYRPDSAYNSYLISADTWNTGMTNSYLKAGWKKQYPIPNGTGRWQAEIRSSAPGSDSDYANLRFESVYDLKILAKTLNVKYRLYLQLGEGNTPLESQTYLAGGNPEDMYGNDFYRARGFFADNWTENNMGRSTSSVHFGGGYNLRGYTGYRAEFEDGAAAWYGNNGAALNIEIEFDERIPFRPKLLKDHFKLDTYIFGDAGILGRSVVRSGFDKPEWDKIRADFGAGAALGIFRSRNKGSKPLILRADFPLLLTATPFTQDNFQFRWLIAVGRAF